VADLPVTRYAKLSRSAIVNILFDEQKNLPINVVLPAFFAAC
jgi:hypothetical protein